MTYLPTREADLVGFADNFAAKIAVLPETFGLNSAQATAFDALAQSFRDAYAALEDPTKQSPPFTAAKNMAKSALIHGENGIYQLVALVQAHPGITEQQLTDLRLTVRSDQRTPVPPPEDAPEMDVVRVIGRTVRIRLHNENTIGHRRKPAGVKGAAILSYVGPDAPDDITAWHFEGNTTKTVIDIPFPPTLEPGAKVWLTAYWFNPRMQSGPACQPQSTHLGAGLSKAGDLELKLRKAA
jgi:hypothetical protein